MTNEEIQDNLRKIDEMLNQIVKARAELIEFFGPETVLAAETLMSFEKIQNDIKQLRGQILEGVV